jgi:hypothetical protein
VGGGRERLAKRGISSWWVGFERFWAICTRRPCPMDDGLARLITLENARRVQGVRFRRVSRRKEWCGGRRLRVERLKRLTQILKQRARQLEIRGVEAFREAVVDEGERIPGLIALAVFSEQACLGHR